VNAVAPLLDLKDSPLDYALQYANLGVPVFPIFEVMPDGRCACGNAECGASGKHPRTARGHLDATTDRARIEKWWQSYPRANVGMPTGIQIDRIGGRVAVLDIDPRNRGEESLEDLRDRNGPFPDTVVALTGGGGTHYWFRYEGALKSRIIAPGIDLQADGKYVILPPSTHRSGRTYEFEDSAGVVDVPIAPLPTWLVAAKTVPSAPTAGVLATGSRNSTLFRLGCAMRRQGTSASRIEEVLLAENRDRCQPPLSNDEIRKIAASAGGYAPTATDNPGGVVRERAASDLVRDGDNAPPIEYLPFIGLDGYIVRGLSHLLAGYPRAGKTKLLDRCSTDWLAKGDRVLYITEESELMWRGRLRGRASGMANMQIVFGLGTSPQLLRERAFSGDESVVVVDALRNLLRFSDENDNSQVAREINPWIVAAREAGKTLICVHHSRKGSGEHGEAIAGGHALLGMFDIALEVVWTNSSQPRRRTVRSYARVINPGEFVYEMDIADRLVVLGSPDAVALDATKERLRPLLTEDWQMTKEVAAAIGEPRPSDEQIRLALNALAKDRVVDRDPPLDASESRGRSHRWRLRKS
jgi:hypothetical protein